MMSKVLLIFFVVISWYVAGMVHSFALMLYAVCLTFFMLAMHFVTSIYKKKSVICFLLLIMQVRLKAEIILSGLI